MASSTIEKRVSSMARRPKVECGRDEKEGGAAEEKRELPLLAPLAAGAAETPPAK